MKALFIGAHCDDIELGCGGIINKFCNEWDIRCAVMSRSGIGSENPNLYKTSTESLKILGLSSDKLIFSDNKVSSFQDSRQTIWEELNFLNNTYNPQIVFTHNPDEHQDHVVTYQETIRNFRNVTIIKYQIMRSDRCIKSNFFIELDHKNIYLKIKALLNYKCYAGKNYMQPDIIMAQAKTAGLYIEKTVAEGFIVDKVIWPI